jgi:cytochrome P450
MVVQPYGPGWRSIRKIMHSILNINNASIFAPFQDLESKQLLYEVLERPEHWWKANQRFANSVIMSVVFGKRILDRSSENVEKLFATSNEFIAALQPGANLVDTFYVLDRLPGPLKWWRKRGHEAFNRVINVYETEVADLTKRIEQGTCPPCFASKFLADPETEKLGRTQTLFALGSLMEAGSDTSRMTLSQILAAAATDARWVKSAQAEIDCVCGHGDRLPDFADRKNLPYLSAVAKEGFRWRPFAEIGVPHMLTQDDEFEGYRFPKDTVFTWNSWAIALSEDEYEDPERFWPERWLKGDGSGKVVVQGAEEGAWRDGLEDPLKGHWSFGAGRRVCTGYQYGFSPLLEFLDSCLTVCSVGDGNVWIAAARLLACFDFEAVEVM